jgi:hypothetical protein
MTRPILNILQFVLQFIGKLFFVDQFEEKVPQIYNKSPKVKKSPKGRNFAQSGHPDCPRVNDSQKQGDHMFL